MRKVLFLCALLMVLLLFTGCRQSTTRPQQPAVPVEVDVQEPETEDGTEPGTFKGNVIISDNPVQTDAGRLLNDLDKEIDALLQDLEQMDNLEDGDLNF